MTSYHLSIVTPDGARFDGQAEELIVRTIAGDIGILAGHLDLVTALGIGEARVTVNGSTRHAACTGGLLTVTKNEVRVVAATFEWAQDIDLARAKASEERARRVLDNARAAASDLKIAEARLKRALLRQSVGKTV